LSAKCHENKEIFSIKTTLFVWFCAAKGRFQKMTGPVTPEHLDIIEQSGCTLTQVHGFCPDFG